MAYMNSNQHFNHKSDHYAHSLDVYNDTHPTLDSNKDFDRGDPFYYSVNDDNKVFSLFIIIIVFYNINKIKIMRQKLIHHIQKQYMYFCISFSQICIISKKICI